MDRVGVQRIPVSGALYTYDMIATIDGQWLQHNAPLLMDTAAAAAGIEFHRGTEAFLEVLDQIGTPDLDKREIIPGYFRRSL